MVPKVKNIEFEEITLPLLTTFSTSLGKKDWINSVFVRVTLDNGACGVGECPTSFAFKHETPEKIKSVLKEISHGIVGKPISLWEEILDTVRSGYPHAHIAVSGLEVAVFRAYLNSFRIKEHVFWGEKKSVLETDITIPFLSDREKLDKWLELIVEKGFKIFKIKLSGHIDMDKDFVSHIDGVLKEKLAKYILRLDGNQGFDKNTFLLFCDYLLKKGYAIDCIEQPLKKDDVRGERIVKGRCAFPIILDESIMSYKDLEMAVSEKLCDGVNIKIAKSGIIESKKILDGANKYGLKKMIGCMTETMVGLSSGIFFAAGTDGFDYIDLDSIHFLYNPFGGVGIEIEGPIYKI